MTHIYRNNGLDIVIDGNSGAVHVVDSLSAALIKEYENGDSEAAIAAVLRTFPEAIEAELREILAELDELRAEGSLYNPPLDDTLPKMQKQSVKALCLHVAHACNMTCDYCFAGQGKFSGKAALMSFETGKRALDWLVENSRGRRNLEVDFFGGEPLLNFDVVKKLVAYARGIEDAAGKNFRFTLTTNGLLLDDEIGDFLNKECHNVVLSLDGRREVNDKYRKTCEGCGSYDTIVPKFKRFVERRGGGYYIRGTYTTENLDFASDILHMADLGFDELSMEPIVGGSAETAIGKHHLPAIFAEYDRLAAEMAKREKNGSPFTFYHYILDLEGGPCGAKRLAGCGAGSEYFAVTPDGSLFPCHQFVGDAAYNMGDVWEGIGNTTLRERFAASSYTDKEECRECWAKLFCAGGCAANAYHSTGDIGGIYRMGCEIFRRRIENAVMLAASRNLCQTP